MSVVGGAAGGEGEGAAGCNDKNKNPTIECGEKTHTHRDRHSAKGSSERRHGIKIGLLGTREHDEPALFVCPGWSFFINEDVLFFY